MILSDMTAAAAAAEVISGGPVMSPQLQSARAVEGCSSSTSRILHLGVEYSSLARHDGCTLGPAVDPHSLHVLSCQVAWPELLSQRLSKACRDAVNQLVREWRFRV